jgi:hypothetical protein
VSGEKKPSASLVGLILSSENKKRRKRSPNKAHKEKNLFKGKIR